MHIKITDEAYKDLADISDYISLDSKERAQKFLDEILLAIEKIANFPKKHRRSIYFDDENFRDLIYKKYTIVYEISRDEITVLSIFKARNHPAATD